MKAMSGRAHIVPVAGIILILLYAGCHAEEPQPVVLVYAGRLPGYADALAGIINETGTRTIVARCDTLLRALANLPQVGCIVIPALNPSDFDFLREFAPVLQRHFEEGGSVVGLSAACSMDLKGMATTIFPIHGNATGKGKNVEGVYGSTYVLSDVLEEITGGLPREFVITQSDYTYQSSQAGPVPPSSDVGKLSILYKEQSTGIPLVVALERDGGGRSVSLPGCYVAVVERLPFHWGKLVGQPEFKELLRRSVAWAMAGSERHDRLAQSREQSLKAEAERMSRIAEVGEQSQARSRQRRLVLLVGLWAAGLVFQFFLVIRFIIPRMRGPIKLRA